MELQWPLIIFTTLVAWSAGLFASQCTLALKGDARAAQIPAWIVSAVLLIVGGVSVFFHLGHFERIFNGFGHITSGITQELIAIVVLAVVAVVYLVFLVRGEKTVPAWIAVVGIAASVVLVCVVAHSYMMAARPAWDSMLWVLAVLGEACAMGPLTMVALCALCAGGDGGTSMSKALGTLAIAGSAANAVTTIAYSVFLQTSADSFSRVGYYFDSVNPTKSMLDVFSTVGDQAMLLWGGAVVIGSAVPLACALLARKKPDTWAVLGAAGAFCAVVGAICLRMAFYNIGLSVFMFY